MKNLLIIEIIEDSLSKTLRKLTFILKPKRGLRVIQKGKKKELFLTEKIKQKLNLSNFWF